MTPFFLKISSPEGDLLAENAVFLSVRGTEGDLAVMAGHIPFVSYVSECDCKIELENGEERIGHTLGGILTVGKEKVILLCGSFRWKEDT